MSPVIVGGLFLHWGITIFLLLLSLSLVKKVNELSQPNFHYKTLVPGEPAPAFEAVDLSGRNRSLTDFTDRSVAFVFASSSCSPCRERIPEILKERRSAAAAGVEIVVVLLDEIDQAQAFASELDLPDTTLIAPLKDNPLKTNYMVPGTPSFCVVDENHKVVTSDFINGSWDLVSEDWNKRSHAHG